eukprot:GHVU01024523.1.p1 GENE.GHVU01024523.1~~GHVU01024523.1.p1  ORF type:complete len:399 (+),score=43.28 GHVU01024523.1:878-2074(+)
MTTGWRLSFKQATTEETRIPKARWYCRGFQDTSATQTYAAASNYFILLLSFLYIISQSWEVCTVDVKNAFLNAEPDGREPVIHITKPPPEMPYECPFPTISPEEWQKLRHENTRIKPGFYKLLKALYGDKQSPRWWSAKLRSVLTTLGFIELYECCFIKRTEGGKIIAVLVPHVDDLLIASEDTPAVIRTITTAFNCHPPNYFTEGVPNRFLALDVTVHPSELTVSQATYLQSTTQPAPHSKRAHPLTQTDLRPPRPEEIDATLVPSFRSDLGKLGWITGTNPALTAAYSELSMYSLCPSQKIYAALQRVLHHAQTAPGTLTYTAIQTPAIYAYSDAAYCRTTKTGRYGWVIYVGEKGERCTRNNNMVAWKSKRIKLLLDSSTAAELHALKALIDPKP